VDGVKFSADDAGHEIVEVAGQLSILEFFSETFTHFAIIIPSARDTGPGHPEEIIIVEPVEPGSGAGANLGDFAAVLDQAIVEAVTSVLNATPARAIAPAVPNEKSAVHPRCGQSWPNALHGEVGHH
jgi:hypothetical protein